MKFTQLIRDFLFELTQKSHRSYNICLIISLLQQNEDSVKLCLTIDIQDNLML
jgi:hypothetical protein